MYSSCALFSPVFCEVPFRSFQVVSKTRRKFETGLLYSIILIMTSIEVVIGNCLQVYVAQLWKYGASRIIESRLWPFGVTWRHPSRDHSTRGGRLPIGGPLWPCLYLAPLWTYGCLEFPPEGSSRNKGRSSVGRSSILHWSHILLFATLRT